MKAILVIDMQKRCDDCQFMLQGLCLAHYGKKIDFENDKPTWCPLKEMPTKRQGLTTDEYTKYMNEGYNACIDEILGEE